MELRRSWIVGLIEALEKAKSFPIQDEPEGGGSFQYKMSLERVAC
jgi:hypothetical protein